MGIEVDGATLRSIVRRLERGAGETEAMGGSVPGAPDAGEMSGLFSMMLLDVTDAAASMAEGMHLAAAAVREAQETYDATETSAQRTFGGLTPS